MPIKPQKVYLSAYKGQIYGRKSCRNGSCSGGKLPVFHFPFWRIHEYWLNCFPVFSLYSISSTLIPSEVNQASSE